MFTNGGSTRHGADRGTSRIGDRSPRGSRAMSGAYTPTNEHVPLLRRDVLVLVVGELAAPACERRALFVADDVEHEPAILPHPRREQWQRRVAQHRPDDARRPIVDDEIDLGEV